MIKLIFIHGILKGTIICVLTNILIISTLLFSSLFLNGGKNNIIQLPVVLPIATIITSTLLSQNIKLMHGVYIALVWLFIFVSVEFIVGLGFNPIKDVYSILTIALIIIMPISVGLSNTNFFINKDHQAQG